MRNSPVQPDAENGTVVLDNGWDMIVVGAGSAGAALAARSAALGKRVLLLESGPDYPSAELPDVWRSPNPLRALRDPAASAHLLQDGLYARRTETQSPEPYAQGRGVGGGSSVNGQIAIRPPMDDFEDWVADGCDDWSPQDVLPYFAKLEDDEEFGDTPYHGRGGPIPIHRTARERWGSVDTALHDAARADGYGWAADVNAPGASGVSPYPINSRGGRRVSTNDAYLEQARALGTLTIRGGTVVDRVLFAGNRAIGVRTLVDGVAVEEYADRIVLCAGAVHSPAILLRSGVGPAGELRALGVDVVRDLPVGQGLQDHPLIFFGLPLKRESAVRTADDRYTNVCVRYTSDDPAGQPGDMMLVAGNQNVLALARADVRFGAGALLVWINQVYSRGSVRLSSVDPLTQPMLEQRMLSDPRDLSRMRSGVRALVQLAHSDRVAEITHGSPDGANSPLLLGVDDDEVLDAYLLRSAADGQHVTSSCRMGDPAASTTVVDSRCRVLGLDALHVVDASIFPSCPRANPNLATIMAAELMADRLH